jgi:HD-like signal output (HDOD) protein
MHKTADMRLRVIERSRNWPRFPRLVADVLAAADEPERHFDALVHAMACDAHLGARVLAAANALRGPHDAEVFDIAMATAMVGMEHAHHLAILSSLSAFWAHVGPQERVDAFWRRSMVAGICSEEWARHSGAPVSPTVALVAGLLHDVGQLWLDCFALRQHMGTDHALIGAWLVHHWALPVDVIAAVAGHHQPEEAQDIPLVSLLQRALALSHAWSQTDSQPGSVDRLPGPSDRSVGLVSDASTQALLDRITTRCRQADNFFYVLR